MSEIEVPDIKGYTQVYTDLKGARTVFLWRTSSQWPLPSHNWCRFPIRKRFREGLKTEGKRSSREWFPMALCPIPALCSSIPQSGDAVPPHQPSIAGMVCRPKKRWPPEKGKWSVEVPPLISQKNLDLCGSFSYPILARFASQVFMFKYEAKN